MYLYRLWVGKFGAPFNVCSPTQSLKAASDEDFRAFACLVRCRSTTTSSSTYAARLYLYKESRQCVVSISLYHKRAESVLPKPLYRRTPKNCIPFKEARGQTDQTAEALPMFSVLLRAFCSNSIFFSHTCGPKHFTRVRAILLYRILRNIEVFQK